MPVSHYYVKYKGEFSFKKVYSFIVSFFSNRRFDLFETKYKEKADEVEIDWEARRAVTEYYDFNFKINLRIQDMKKLRPPEKEEGFVFGRMAVTIDADLLLNEGKIFRDKGAGKIIHGFYKKVTEREREEKWEDDLDAIAQDLREGIKNITGSEGI